MLPLLHLLGVGERDAVDALQTLGLAVALPVRSRVLKNLIFTYSLMRSMNLCKEVKINNHSWRLWRIEVKTSDFFH